MNKRAMSDLSKQSLTKIIESAMFQLDYRGGKSWIL